MDRKKLDKVLAVAINPGAFEEEAIAALRKAREIIKQHPSLAHPEPVAPPVIPPPDDSIEFKITNVKPFWMMILVSSLSQEAYGLGLRSKISFDYDVVPVAVDIRCDGSSAACVKFKAHLEWIIGYINSQPPQD